MRNMLCLLIVLFLTSTVFSDEPDEKLHQECLYPTVQILNTQQGGGGTGVIVRSDEVNGVWHNVVLTCQHVLGKTTQVGVSKYDNWSKHTGYDTYDGVVFSSDKKLDLGVVLFVTKKKMPVAELSFGDNLFIGTHVSKIGCGFGDIPRLDEGKITAISMKIIDDVEHLRLNAITVFGDSGGPVFHNYKVIGVTRAVRNYQHGMLQLPEDGIAYCVPVEYLKVWNSQSNNSLEFVYNGTKKSPRIPFFRLWMNSQNIQGVR